MRKAFYIPMLLWVSAAPLPSDAQLVINEIMQSNIDCIMDDLNEFPDSWVELCNIGNQPEQLAEYSLGVDPQADLAWKLPSRQILPRQHIVVYCDKAATGLHTSFKLESGKGGAIFLFRNAVTADQLTDIPKQPAPNISYGRETDGNDVWGHQATPTPMAANCGAICTKILGDPIFSEKGKVLTGSHTIKLELSLPPGSPDGTIIRLTTDGSEPTEDSQAYSTPITISNTRLIRAKLFCKGYLSPRSVTQSYIFFPRAVTLPVISLVTDSKYFYDSKVGIYVDGSYKSGQKNYKFDWRRPVNFEYFESEGQESDINQLCETRVQGGASRDSQLKSLVVYTNKRFGKKRLSHEFFPDQRPGITDYKSIILRNAGNDFDYLYMRDAIIQRVMAQHTDLDWQAWQPAIFFVNGAYKGMLNVRERSTGDNIYTNYGGLEDIDMLENWSEVKEGDDKNWKLFKDFYSEQGHTLEEYAQWIDWEEFINLMIMNLYFNNQDFPGNNIVMWRPRQEGGKWRFVAKDTDFGIGLYGSSANYNSIEWLHNPNYDFNRNWANKESHTRLFRRMMDDEDFRREFIDRATIYMGDFLNVGGTREIWDPMYERIRTEYPNHRKLINQWWPNYSTELNNARNWMSSRTNYFYNHLANFYHLGKAVPVEINLEADETDLEAVEFAINGIHLSHSTFNGKFYADRTYHIESTPGDGRQVTAWEITQVSGTGTAVQKMEGPSCSITLPSSCQKVIITALFDDFDGIDTEAPAMPCQWAWNQGSLTLKHIEKGTQVCVYDLQGILIQSLTAGSDAMHITLPSHRTYILKIGDKTVKLGY